ncbi:hypothetical protein DESC_40070 [Desulfosarcina cetonica]|nr:hypothetical protein DESC_40070 [Desulfosarcina cetonica]
MPPDSFSCALVLKVEQCKYSCDEDGEDDSFEPDDNHFKQGDANAG